MPSADAIMFRGWGIDLGGRPRSDRHRSIRIKHIRCAYRYLIEKRSAAWLASRHQCSKRTIYYWVKAVEKYTDEEALMLALIARGNGPR
jgi:hypothetical protein